MNVSIGNGMGWWREDGTVNRGECGDEEKKQQPAESQHKQEQKCLRN
jgi:hypothetical protein